MKVTALASRWSGRIRAGLGVRSALHQLDRLQGAQPVHMEALEDTADGGRRDMDLEPVRRLRRWAAIGSTTTAGGRCSRASRELRSAKPPSPSA
jgi:hypothetical protein